MITICRRCEFPTLGLTSGDVTLDLCPTCVSEVLLYAAQANAVHSTRRIVAITRLYSRQRASA